MKRALCWIYAQAIEIGAFLWLLILYIGARLGFVKTDPIGQGKPILLVHGYCNSGSVWHFLKKRLVERSCGRIYTIDLGYPFDSIESYARKISAIAQKIRREESRSDLILVGHSMGGLASSYYALFLAPKNTVSSVITIGSPLRGTWMANLGIGRCCKEMKPKSHFIEALNPKIANQTEVKFYHIATRTDELVIPQHSAWIKESADSYIVDCIGHVSLIFSSKVAQKISEWIY